MTTTIRTERDPHSITVRIDPSRARATPEPADRRFRDALHDGAGVLLAGVESATSALPGGAVVTAAVRGATSRAISSSEDDATAATSLEDVLGRQSVSQMEYLMLQQRIQEENRRYTTLSNVLKAQHETAKTAIGNIR